MARTFALIAPVHPVLHQVSCNYETIPNAPKHYETHQNMSLGSNGVDHLRSLRKIQCDFVAHQNMSLGSNGVDQVRWLQKKLQRDLMARTFALIEPVQYVLQQVSCSYGTIPNSPKYYKTERNISLGSNGVDWVHSFQKIST